MIADVKKKEKKIQTKNTITKAKGGGNLLPPCF